MNSNSDEPRYDADGNRLSERRPKKTPPHHGSDKGFLVCATIIVALGGLMWYSLLQTLRPAPERSAAAYNDRFEAIGTWREEAIEIIDETTNSWDEAAERYLAGCPEGVNTPPCPFIRGYDNIARADFNAAREALSAENLAARKELAAFTLERRAQNAYNEIEAELQGLELLHPVCLRWYTAEATHREAVRWAFQCPDESDPAPPPAGPAPLKAGRHGFVTSPPATHQSRGQPAAHATAAYPPLIKTRRRQAVHRHRTADASPPTPRQITRSRQK